ncbi:MAG: hypothetical protein M3A44_09895 [Gammaproteobacteria bacterium]
MESSLNDNDIPNEFEFDPIFSFMSRDATVMHLTLEQVQLIRQTAEGIFGAGVQITRFSNNYVT